MKTLYKNRYYLLGALALYGIGTTWFGLTWQGAGLSLISYGFVRCVYHPLHAAQAAKLEKSRSQGRGTAAEAAAASVAVDHHYPFIH